MSTTPLPFGLLLPPRPVLINPAPISLTQSAFSFPSAPLFNHIVVFLLPGATLPAGTLTGVHLQLPTSTEFRFLGAIGEEKPSAIFRVSGVVGEALGVEGGEAEEDMTDVDALGGMGGGGGMVTVGLSIEPAANIAAQLEGLKAANGGMVVAASRGPQQQPTTSPIATKLLAQRIIKNAFNFLGSFAGSASAGGPEVVPLKSFQDWWTKFERRVQNDPGFLEREDQH